MQENKVLRTRNSILDLEKFFIKLKDRELKERAVKIKRLIKDLFLNQLLYL